MTVKMILNTALYSLTALAFISTLYYFARMVGECTLNDPKWKHMKWVPMVLLVLPHSVTQHYRKYFSRWLISVTLLLMCFWVIYVVRKVFMVS